MELMQKLCPQRKKHHDEFSRQEYEQTHSRLDDEKESQQFDPGEEAVVHSVARTVVPVYGTLDTSRKPDDAIRLLSANLNSIRFWRVNNMKAERLRYIAGQYRLDGFGFQEVCVNWAHYRNSETLASLIKDGNTQIRSVDSFNKHESENKSNQQRGGTSTMLIDQLQAFVKERGSDHTGLGRWSYYLVEGSPGHRTLIVTAYAPCGRGEKSTLKNLSKVTQQHLRFIQHRGYDTDPKTMFREDLISFLMHWRKSGVRIILMMDANENVKTGELAQELRQDGLDMEEVVHAQKPDKLGPKTWYRGSESIDGIWVTDDIEVLAA